MEKNHKIAVIFLPYLKLLLGTERVYSWKKKKTSKQKKQEENKPSQTTKMT